jgi:NAD(P)H-dependent FMN reductase
MHTDHYLVIVGSTRPTRRSPAIAKWVADLGDQMGGAPFRVIDLKDLGLGMDDEPGIPAKDDYVRETTRAWSEMVQAAKGVVFVSPQYNWGYPAPLKNAIDHLYREWRGKPALIVTYGSQGGGKCAAQLREVLGGMGLRLATTMPALRLARSRIEDNDGAIDPDQDFADHRGEVRAALRELADLALAATPPA